MSKINCDIIRDLLPGYSDKILSESSNKLVKEHLQRCDKCLKEFQEMNKEIPSEIITNQDEEINYLKKYKRNKVLSIIFAVIIAILIAIILFGLLYFYDSTATMLYPIEELETEITEEYVDGKLVWNINIHNIKHNFNYLSRKIIQKDDGSKEIKITFGGAHRIFGNDPKGTRTVYQVDADETVNKMYIDNGFDTKVIWTRDKDK